MGTQRDALHILTMKVKLKRMGSEGSHWMLSRQNESAWHLLERSSELDDLVPSGLAWCGADLIEGRWIVRQIIAAALPAPEWRAVAVDDRPKCAFRIVASA